MPVFEWRSTMPAPAEDVYEYHARPGALSRLTPPWHRLRVVEEWGDVTAGGVTFEVRFGPVPCRWTAEMGRAVPGRQFVDRQVQGPFASWEHTHRFVPVDDERSELIDHVEYGLPAGAVTDMVGEGPAGRVLARLFRFRHQRTRTDLLAHRRWSGRPRLKVAIAGASGLIGSHLAGYFRTDGHDVVRLVRRSSSSPDEISWDPAQGVLDLGALEGADAVVNLSGSSIAGLWTPKHKLAILESRRQATQTLAEAVTRMERPPRVVISVSGVDAYGDRGDAVLTEEAGFGSGFLAGVCREWEGAAAPVREAGIRLVTPRFGLVVSSAGGVLAVMLPAFKAGLGPRLGDGEQYWSWIDLDDLLAGIEWALYDDELSGVVNFAAPGSVTNTEFTKTVARVLGRPSVVAVPSIVLRQTPGRMGEEMFLSSKRVVPSRLLERGFRFAYPRLGSALRFELGRG